MALDADAEEKRKADEAAAKKKAEDDEAAKNLPGAVDPTLVTAEQAEPNPDADPTRLEKKDGENTTLMGESKDNPSKKPPEDSAKKPDSSLNVWESIWNSAAMLMDVKHSLKVIRGLALAPYEVGKGAVKAVVNAPAVAKEGVSSIKEGLNAVKNVFSKQSKSCDLKPDGGKPILPAREQRRRQSGSQPVPAPKKQKTKKKKHLSR